MPWTGTPEEIRGKQRAYREKNRERITAYLKTWKANNKEHVQAERDRWVAENPEKARAQRNRKKSRWQKRRYRCDDIEMRKKRAVNRAQQNARIKNREFNITVEDLYWPEFCPVLGIKLNYGAPSNGRFSADSPSIDRHDPKLGYVKGNCVVMSWRANRIKTDAAILELEKLVSYLRRKAIH